MDDKFNKIKISLMLNYIIIIFTIFATIVMFTGIKFMNGLEPVLESSKIEKLCFFTVDSNLLAGLASLLLAIKERKLLSGKIKKIPIKYYVLKMVGTISVALTFLVVVFYLARISSGGIMSMLQNCDLFFHLVIPILCIVSFCFFEKTDKIKFRYVFFGLLPIFLYGIFYLTNVLMHIENGTVSKKYDFYWFVQGGLHQIYFVVPLMFAIVFIIGVILWKINKKSDKWEL